MNIRNASSQAFTIGAFAGETSTFEKAISGNTVSGSTLDFFVNAGGAGAVINFNGNTETGPNSLSNANNGAAVSPNESGGGVINYAP